jgi:hypothetical protein
MGLVREEIPRVDLQGDDLYEISRDLDLCLEYELFDGTAHLRLLHNS